MKWVWELNDWPKFTYDLEVLKTYESKFLENSGLVLGSLKHIGEGDLETIRVDLLSDEAFTTSRIEGEVLDRNSVQSSIRKHLGLKTDNRKVGANEYGVSEMMVDLYQNHSKVLTHEMLHGWHSMLMNGRRDLEEIGGYRKHEDPMQIISGNYQNSRVFFEAPPSALVPENMDDFLGWYKDAKTLPVLIHAGIAHLYFEIIHPYEDGNGRIGRALAEKVLSERMGRPSLTAIAHTIEVNRKKYYEALHQSNHSLDITKWLVFFSEIILEAQEYTLSLIDFVIAKTKFFEKHKSMLNERQQKAVLRMFKEGVGGFKGGLSAENYMRITGTSRATTTRDLANLVEKAVFRKTGELKSSRYFLNLN